MKTRDILTNWDHRLSVWAEKSKTNGGYTLRFTLGLICWLLLGIILLIPIGINWCIHKREVKDG